MTGEYLSVEIFEVFCRGLRLRVDAASLSPAGVLSFVQLGLRCKRAMADMYCCDSLIIVLAQIRKFWKLPTIGIKLVGANGRVSTFQCPQ